MKAGLFYPLTKPDLVKLPRASQLFSLPNRQPVGYDRESGNFVTLPGLQAVAAFSAPGHTLTYSTSYEVKGSPKPLPLFSYGACAIYKGEVHVAAIKVDNDKRHDSTLIDMTRVKKNITKFKKLFPKNRLIGHLEGCAICYGCPNAQNFFLSRYEAPLPTSPSCNAACAGCISYQAGKIKCSQPRISFVPSPEELAEVALFHIANVKDAIVSFGQGCEGEPLLQGDIIEQSIKLIRKMTSKGTINLNTNGSLTETLAKLFDAGLDTVRISLNSARENYYSAYYKPKGYSFKDVVGSIALAKKKRKWVSINYLTMPGFTDSHEEMAALENLIEKYRIDMIQWRNLNYDPLLYFKILKIPADQKSDLIGVRQEIDSLNKRFLHLRMGYFNPRATASRHR